MKTSRKVLNRTFKGVNLNRPPEKLSPDEFQLDLNGDRRRTNAWAASTPTAAKTAVDAPTESWRVLWK